MTVYLPKGATTWYYDFRWRGQRHWGTTHQLTKADAALVESQIKLRLRQQAGGIAPFNVEDTPPFSKWAGVYAKQQARYVGRPDVIERTLSVVLEFWGREPRKAKRRPTGTNTHHVRAPYHDLRLGHPIADPTWLTKFEAWMASRRASGSTRNSYLSALSGMYKLALQPEHRAATGIPSNPFADIRRSPPNRRLVALSPSQVQAWIAAAPPHVRTAMAIAALAPKLRLQTILGLEWKTHFDPELTRLVVHAHKTRRQTGLPQITPIDPQLREILEALRKASTSRYVVAYRDDRVESIKKATRSAARAAGLTWGVSTGVTFHTIRHSVATLLAQLGVGERLRMEIMGHKEIRTTQQYTHLAAADQVGPHAQLSAALPLKAVVLQSPSSSSDGVSGPAPKTARKRQQKRRSVVARSRQVKKA